MYTFPKLISRLGCAVLGSILFVFLSCGGSSNSTTKINSVSVIPTASSIKINGQQTFTANALDASGNTVGGVAFTWQSSTAGVATIDHNGVATGITSGQTQITAIGTVSSQTVTSSPVTLTVLPQIGSVAITPTSATIKVGAQQQFMASAKDVNGNPVNGAVFDWAISFSGVATIDQNGLATGVSAGMVVVTASVGGVTSPMATLNVTN